LCVLLPAAQRHIKFHAALDHFRECITRRSCRKSFADLHRAQGDAASSIARAISSRFREDPRKKRLIRACQQYRFQPRPVAHHNSFTDFVIARRPS
jgi:hypothetical protein